MKALLTISCIISLSTLSCRQSASCTCYSNGVVKNYDLGTHFSSSHPDYQPECDTLGAHDHLDTCRVMIAK